MHKEQEYICKIDKQQGSMTQGISISCNNL